MWRGERKRERKGGGGYFFQEMVVLLADCADFDGFLHTSGGDDDGGEIRGGTHLALGDVILVQR